MDIISLEELNRLYWLGRYTERVYTTIRDATGVAGVGDTEGVQSQENSSDNAEDTSSYDDTSYEDTSYDEADYSDYDEAYYE